MPSVRRVKVFGVLVFLFVVTVLFWTATLRQQRTQDSRTVGDFYARTVHALDKRPPSGGRGRIANDDDELEKTMKERLDEAAQVAKDKANAKAPKPDPPSAVVGVGSAAEGARDERGVAGRKKYNVDDGPQEPITEETKEEHEVEVELNTILKKSPIIIFSKSYCPHSKRAKGILLDKYMIEPAPFVVELDQHPLGSQLQARLAELTGRRTVPNVLINGVSIGGGDDTAELDTTGTLIAKIKDLAGKRMTTVQLRASKAPAEDHEASEKIAHGLR